MDCWSSVGERLRNLHPQRVWNNRPLPLQSQSLKKVLSKLLPEDRYGDWYAAAAAQEVQQHVPQPPPPTTNVRRHKKSEKLPAGVAYTCAAESQDMGESKGEAQPA